MKINGKNGPASVGWHRCAAWFALQLLLVSPVASAVGPTIDIWEGLTQEFGNIGSPQRWINITGNAVDPDGVVSLSFSLNGQPDSVLAMGPDSRRLAEAGDFNIEIDRADLLEGSNQVLVTAEDGIGDVTTTAITVTYTGNTIWPRNWVTDWQSATEVSDVVQILDGRWSLVAGGVRTAQIGYDRAFALGQEEVWDSYEVTVPITVHGIDLAGYNPISISPGVGFTNRWTGHTTLVPGEQPHAYWLPAGSTGWFEYGIDQFMLDDGRSFTIFDNTGLQIELGQPYLWKLRIENLPDGTTFHAFKVWKTAETEPSQWLLSGIYNTPNINETGSLIVYPHHVDATIGNITIVDLGEDNTPPEIDNVQETGQPSGLIVSWSTNEATTTAVEYGTDTSYGLGLLNNPGYRSSHQIFLPNLQAGTTYHYRIVVEDASGNQTVSPDYQFVFQPSSGGALVSDDFSDPTLNTGVWNFIDTLGDVSLTMTGTQVELDIPGNAQFRDFWAGSATNDLPRLLQSAPNIDFEVEAKFESPQNANYQIQGITVEQSSLDILRIEFLYIGSQLYFFAAAIIDDSAEVFAYQPVTLTAPMYMRVGRSGDDWTVQLSEDGSVWTTVSTFSQPMVVNAVGVYASGSPGTAHTALIDYFFDTVSPIVPEDGGGGDVEAPTTPSGLSVGSTSDSTAQLVWNASTDNVGVTGYEISRDGLVVTTVTGTTYTDTGLASGTTYAYEVVALDAAGNRSGTASVSATTTGTDVQPPTVPTNFQTTSLGEVSLGLGWTASTDNVGVTGYEVSRDGLVVTTVAGTTYTDTGLASGTTYAYEVVALDAAGNRSGAASLLATTTSGGGIFVSDDFSAPSLNTGVWNYIDTLGDVSLTMTGTQVQLDIPGNAQYRDFWAGSATNDLPRLLQPAANTDFEVEAKFESPQNANYQIQGITVEQSSLDILRIEFLYIGSQLYFFAAAIIDDSAEVFAYQPVTLTAPMYMRVGRSGDDWTVQLSEDGSVWTTVSTFSQPMVVNAVGVYASGSPGTAHTALIDYFFDTASPIVPEDGGGGDVEAPTTPSGLSVGSTSDSTAQLVWNASTDNVGVTGYEVSRDGLVVTTVAGTTYTDTGLASGTTYAYEVVALDAAGNRSGAASLLATTTSGGGIFVSDDFSAPSLNTGVWNYIDTLGDVSLTMTGTQVQLDIPGNAQYRDFWAGSATNDLPRLLQPAANTDFEVEAKFESPQNANYQIQGITVEQSSLDILRIEFLYINSQLYFFAAAIIDDSAEVFAYQPVTLTAPMYMRVGRSGDDWTVQLSEDGSVWTTVSTFSQPMVVNAVGVYASGSPGTAHTALIDYFFDTSTPINPGD